jgi:hypothetical protein
VLAVSLLALLGGLLLACGTTTDAGAASTVTTTAATSATTGITTAPTSATTSEDSTTSTTARSAGAKAAPAFSGVTLDGKTITSDQFQGKPLFLVYMTST